MKTTPLPKFNNKSCKDGCNCIEIAERENNLEPVKNYECLGGDLMNATPLDMKTTLLPTLKDKWIKVCKKYDSLFEASELIIEYGTYVCFVDQKLKLWMFIPCNEKGEPLVKPYQYHCYVFDEESDWGKSCEEYKKAEARVLFKGFILKYVGDGNSLVKIRFGISICVIHEDKSITWKLESIQDLKGVELVEWKHKELNLR